MASNVTYKADLVIRISHLIIKWDFPEYNNILKK